MSMDAVALFCEDIRDEANGQHTIVGQYGGVLGVSSDDGALIRLCVIVQMLWEREDGKEKPILKFKFFDGSTKDEPIEWPPPDEASHDIGGRFLTVVNFRFMAVPVPPGTSMQVMLHTSSDHKCIGRMAAVIPPETQGGVSA